LDFRLLNDVEAVLPRQIDVEYDERPRVSADLFEQAVVAGGILNRDRGKSSLKQFLDPISHDGMVIHHERLFHHSPRTGTDRFGRVCFDMANAS